MKRNSPGKAGGIKQCTERKMRSQVRRTLKKPGPEPASSGTVTVSADERQHLVEDVAFFRAEHYRRVDPGKCRKQDRREAEADIAEVLEEHGIR